MGTVITLNKVISMPENQDEIVVDIKRMKVENQVQEVATKYQPLNHVIEGYKKANVQFYKKVKIAGIVYGQEFREILKKYVFVSYYSDVAPHLLTIGDMKGIYPRAALRRLKKNTAVKCSPIAVNLVEAIPLIIERDADITINSGWFSNLGTQLRNAWLQGYSINDNPDWIKFRETEGAQLKNIELKIEDDDFERGYLLVSVSDRGFVFTQQRLPDTKSIQIVRRITNLINEAIIEAEVDEVGEDEE